MNKINPSSSLKDNSFDREKYLYLTTRGRKSGQPREIEIWFTHRDGRFFVIAEYPTSQWVQNVHANPHVRVRIAGNRFPAQARPVSRETESDLHEAIAELSKQKYGWGHGLIVELIPEAAI